MKCLSVGSCGQDFALLILLDEGLFLLLFHIDEVVSCQITHPLNAQQRLYVANLFLPFMNILMKKMKSHSRLLLKSYGTYMEGRFMESNCVFQHWVFSSPIFKFTYIRKEVDHHANKFKYRSFFLPLFVNQIVYVTIHTKELLRQLELKIYKSKGIKILCKVSILSEIRNHLTGHWTGSFGFCFLTDRSPKLFPSHYKLLLRVYQLLKKTIQSGCPKLSPSAYQK
ncbi:hypothetical protein EGR_05404 [Echinococcus granulosus]|uniref:Uncharacterized protein n=1 Tax=Echinococcus granulosus TaxID=6210 RepID=W6V1N0_ECHGR|nr:hypothetical protein EGR_05404 [Echinococcus granulosus]EUB59784.1 hypothetical protein EGR_05404 [Echinococcus granulosus]